MLGSLFKRLLTIVIIVIVCASFLMGVTVVLVGIIIFIVLSILWQLASYFNKK